MTTVSSFVSPTRGLSLVRRLDDWARTSSEAVAFRYGHNGAWADCSWSRYRDEATLVAAGLISLGFVEGDRLAILGAPRAEWLFGDIGAQAAGGLVLGIPPNAPVEDVAHFFQDARPRIAFAADADQLDKAIKADAEEGVVEHFVLISGSEILAGDDRVLRYADFRARAERQLADSPKVWESAVARFGDGEQINSIYYTSGTTGRPKGVLHCTNSIVSGWGGAFDYAQPTPADRATAYMPLSSIAERWPSIYLPIVYGVVAHLPEAGMSVVEAFRQTRPTLMIGTPWMWEQFVDDARTGEDVKESVPDQFGVGALRFVLIGGSSLPKAMIEQWRGWNLELREMYASTECGVVAAQVEGPVEIGVGSPVIPTVKVTTDALGGVVVNSPGLFRGYWNNPTATADAMSEAGFHTGDMASIVERRGRPWLQIGDRVSSLIKLTTGVAVSPGMYEERLSEVEGVRRVVLVGDGRPYLGALVELDERLRGASSNLSQQAISEHFQRVNGDLRSASLEEVKEFRILPEPIEAYPEVVTATGKLRRNVLVNLCADLVDDIYQTDA